MSHRGDASLEAWSAALLGASFGLSQEEVDAIVSNASVAEEVSGGSALIDASAPSELQSAIETISNNAEEASLLSNPFLDEPELEGTLTEVGPFVSPLTNQDRTNIQIWQDLIKVNESSIQILENAIPDIFDPFNWLTNAIHGPQITALRAKNLELQSKINQLFAKEAIARDAHNKLVAEAAAANAAILQNAAILVELEALTGDFFEQFQTAGLTGLEKVVRPEFEREAKEYISDVPEVIFVSDYIVDGKFAGMLLCFERFRKSTHYEVFKRSIFRNNSAFRRHLFLEKTFLEKETADFMPYVQNTLGFKDLREEDVFLVLDTQINVDRIYEYCIAAARVPAAANEVDYDLILEVQERLRTELAGDFNVFNYASAHFGGARDFAWLICVLNEGIPFFGREASQAGMISVATNLDEIVTSSGLIKLFLPESILDPLSIYQESALLFGIKETFNHLVGVLGGLPKEIADVVSLAVDDDAGTFSFDVFRNNLKVSLPVFDLIFEIASTNDTDALEELSQTGTLIPLDEGTINIGDTVGISLALKFINDTYIAITSAQTDETFERLVQIRALIEFNREDEEPVEKAINTIRSEFATDMQFVSAPTGDFFQMAAGEVHKVEQPASNLHARSAAYRDGVVPV